MKLRLKTVVASAASVAIVGGALTVLGAPAALASGLPVPSWEPNVHTTYGSLGSITLYDSSGHVVTGGLNSSNPVATYAVANGTTTDVAPLNKAQLSIATPDGTNLTYNWSSDVLSANTVYPVASPPAALAGLPANQPYSTSTSTDFSINNYLSEFPNTQTAAGQANMYELRLITNATHVQSLGKYFSTDIEVNSGTTALADGLAPGHWQVVYPVPAVATSVSTPVATPPSPVLTGTSVTLSSTVTAADSSHPAGSVHFFDGTTDLGAATFNATTGVATFSYAPGVGTHSYTAVFTPAVPASYTGNTSSALSYTVQAPGSITAVNLSGPSTVAANTAFTLSAVVVPNPTTGTPAGTMTFFNGTTQLGSTTTGAANVYSFTDNTGLATGTYSNITAVFTPSGNAFGTTPVTSAPITITVTAPACTTCTDQQTITVVVPAGTLAIATPYTAASPFNLGTMALNPGQTGFFATGDFGGGTAANAVTITDTRSGDLGWTAALVASNLSNGSGGSISAGNLSFTGVTPTYIAGNNLTSGNVTTSDVTSNASYSVQYAPTYGGTDGLAAKHTFATAAVGHSVGTVYIDGAINLYAPTSTPAGTYTGTITFTIG